MSPIALEEQVEKFQDMIGSTNRIGVSEFARSKDWRSKLPVAGCFEVVDRGVVVGYMLAPEYAQALSKKIAELEEQAEKNQIAAMFKAREDRTDFKTGNELKAAALSYFDDSADTLAEIVHGS